ncbi:MAG: hypothetical protein SFX18_08425 [Pirellulales bacterium]|nr:hypothetical protein [Pirellulales bacterium]
METPNSGSQPPPSPDPAPPPAIISPPTVPVKAAPAAGTDVLSNTVPLTPSQRRYLWLWGAGIALLFALTGWLAMGVQGRNRQQTAINHRMRMDPRQNEEGLTPIQWELPANARPLVVTTGIYLDRISEISIRDVTLVVDFYIWFRWRGGDFDPAESFQVVNGTIDSREVIDKFDNGDEHYVQYRVLAKITKFFDVARFPCDEHLITINIESPIRPRAELLFAVDQDNTHISSRVKVTGFAMRPHQAIEKAHTYKTNFGDPRLAGQKYVTFSQFRLGFEIVRSGWGFYLKMFLPLYISVSIAMLAFFIRPTNVDPRFGLGVGGLFAAVANSYITSALLPDSGILVLADLINELGIFMILLTLIQSAISLYILEKLEAETFQRWFDRISFALLGSGYVLLNVALPWSATAA